MLTNSDIRYRSARVHNEHAYNPESKPPLILWHGSLNEDCEAVWLACSKWKVI